MPSTLDSSVTISGIGLHSGVKTTVSILPAPPQTGRYFARVDLPNSPIIPAKISFVTETTLSTQLSCQEASVRTVEHLLAALTAMGVRDARIEINGAEVPLIDGSALPWVEAIGGNAAPDIARSDIPILSEAIWVRQGDAFAAAIPAPTTCYTYGIDFDVTAIGKQWHTFKPETDSFVRQIAPARTFALAHQIDALRAAGLIKGGSLDNALVCDLDGWINPPLRFPDEPARHKLLDLIGDLSLLGIIPQAHYIAYKASHNLHVQLAQKIANAIL